MDNKPEQPPVPITPRVDPGQEGADIRRLLQAGDRNQDLETTAAGIARLHRLAKKQGERMPMDITDPTVAKIFGLDKSPPQED